MNIPQNKNKEMDLGRMLVCQELEEIELSASLAPPDVALFLVLSDILPKNTDWTLQTDEPAPDILCPHHMPFARISRTHW